MNRPYRELNWLGSEWQKDREGRAPRALHILEDGRPLEVRHLLHRAATWLAEQLAILGRSLPCIETELACEMPFVP